MLSRLSSSPLSVSALTVRDFDTQEVWQADPAAPARAARICGLIHQLQGAQEGVRHPLDRPLRWAPSTTNTYIAPQLIKQLSASPTIPPASSGLSRTLRANKDVFFFRLERELDKVNAFYLQKEDEFTLRLKTLLDRKRVVQSKRAAVYAPTPLSYAALFEGVQQFDGDLNKLQVRLHA